ncbi:MAG: hypothetical protein JWR27_2777 [Aeromicrobium sp.]|jgi:hypothetical protein|nr:hypothetical protein [Aeromicrobium sp.]
MTTGRRRADRRDGAGLTGAGLLLLIGFVGGFLVTITGGARHPTYPWHTEIVATTFWVGEVSDPDAADGSQVLSTYDDSWQQSYGGCDGTFVGSQCKTEKRTARNGYFPTSMTPRQNPFYLDLPYDDLHDATGFRHRSRVIPWADDVPYRDWVTTRSRSLMKNRWVEMRRDGRNCFGQIQDAGPGQYHDATYVFGDDDARPVNRRFNGAGMDVSPAINGCLNFSQLDGTDDRVDWRFVEAEEVPDGPWKKVITSAPPST